MGPVRENRELRLLRLRQVRLLGRKPGGAGPAQASCSCH